MTKEQSDAELDALRAAFDHVCELEDAWSRGAIHERDGKGGMRSNRNTDVRVLLEKAIAARLSAPVSVDRVQALTKDYCGKCGHPHIFHGPGGCTYGHYCECKNFEQKPVSVEAKGDQLQPIVKCDCGFTIDCRNDRGREVECPQCGNQYLRKVSPNYSPS